MTSRIGIRGRLQQQHPRLLQSNSLFYTPLYVSRELRIQPPLFVQHPVTVSKCAFFLCRCRKKCERRPCKLGHPCTKKCFQDCGQCLYKVEKTVPMCGHVATMECKKDPHTWKCQERCEGKLPCGHQCSGSCGDCRTNKSHSVVCTEEVCPSISSSFRCSLSLLVYLSFCCTFRG